MGAGEGVYSPQGRASVPPGPPLERHLLLPWPHQVTTGYACVLQPASPALPQPLWAP